MLVSQAAHPPVLILIYMNPELREQREHWPPNKSSNWDAHQMSVHTLYTTHNGVLESNALQTHMGNLIHTSSSTSEQTSLAQKIIRCPLPHVEEIATSRYLRQVKAILSGPSYPTHHLFDPLPSGWYRSIKDLEPRIGKHWSGGWTGWQTASFPGPSEL